MSKKIKIDFYRVSITEDTGVSFESILEKVSQLPDDARTETVRHTPVVLAQASVNQQFWEGDIVRLRMTDVPVKGSLSGKIEDIGLEDDEGLGEQAAFLYHPPTRILVLQSRQYGVTASNFVKYFQTLSGLSNYISIDPVIQAEVWQRLAKMPIVRKFDIRVSGLDSLQILANSNLSVKEITRLSEEFRAPEVAVELSVGRKRKESLSWEKVKETALSLARITSRQGPQVTNLKISAAADDESEAKVLDILEDRMSEVVEVDLGRDRTLSYAKRQTAIRIAWERRQDEILKMYSDSKN